VVVYNLVISLVQLHKVNQKHSKVSLRLPQVNLSKVGTDALMEGGTSQSQRLASQLNLDQPISLQDYHSNNNLINDTLDQELEVKLKLNKLEQDYKRKGKTLKCLYFDVIF
jgi:hypothetical protein